MLQKIIRAGKHSLAVIIPAPFIHALGINPGDSVHVQANMDRGTVIMKFTGTLQLRLPTANRKK